jgi:hypothetical protein
LVGGSRIVTPVSHTFFALAALALLGAAARRIRARTAAGTHEVVAVS